MFAGRPPGLTLRRTREAHVRPHDASERFDPEFPTALQCHDCGQYGYGPSKNMADAMREHRAVCPARRTKIDQPHVATVLYPRT